MNTDTNVMGAYAIDKSCIKTLHLAATSSIRWKGHDTMNISERKGDSHRNTAVRISDLRGYIGKMGHLTQEEIAAVKKDLEEIEAKVLHVGFTNPALEKTSEEVDLSWQRAFESGDPRAWIEEFTYGKNSEKLFHCKVPLLPEKCLMELKSPDPFFLGTKKSQNKGICYIPSEFEEKPLDLKTFLSIAAEHKIDIHIHEDILKQINKPIEKGFWGSFTPAVFPIDNVIKDKGQIVGSVKVNGVSERAYSDISELLPLLIFMTTHYLRTGERLYENIWVRCSDRALVPFGEKLGNFPLGVHFDSSGIRIASVVNIDLESYIDSGFVAMEKFV